MDKGIELLSLRIAECHNVFLYCALFAAHVAAPSVVTRTSIQTTLAESMTEATSTVKKLTLLASDRRDAACVESPSLSSLGVVGTHQNSSKPERGASQFRKSAPTSHAAVLIIRS